MALIIHIIPKSILFVYVFLF